MTLDSKSNRISTKERYGFIYETNRETISRLFYVGVSTDQAPQQESGATADAVMLQVPDDLDPRILALGRELRAKAEAAAGPRALADRVSNEILDWFVVQKFRYTKEPGALQGASGSEELAKFLFEKKKGFCEHYAAAFATLARAAGVPARVTVGFHGGKFNELADYIIVRSMEAHAWAEVWREDPSAPNRGRWTRVDPTSVIAPLRLRIGGDFNLLDEGLQATSAEEYQRRVASLFERMSLRFEFAWDAVQMKWNGFLNSYDFEFQRTLLSSLGLADAPRLLLAAIALVGVGVIVGALSFVLRRRSKKRDPLLSEWRAFCRKLEKAGLEPRGFSEGPLKFAQRASERWPVRAEQIRLMAGLYCELRYGPASTVDSAKSAKKFRHSVRRFSIEASSRSTTS
ncbi:MAG: transglutaminase domain-containing protein [Bdellovibrionota bacterium]